MLPTEPIPADVERALEKTLIQGGTALISPGSIEITPSFGYAFDARSDPLLVMVGGVPEVVSSEQRHSFLQARLGARIGLPANSQLDVSIPYRFAFREDVLSLAGSPVANVERNASAIGDVTLGLSHVISGRDRSTPRVIGSVSGNLGTADREAGEGLLGGGFPGIGAGLSVSQRLDPLVLAGHVSYDSRFSEGGIDPGDRWGYSLATYLAASPETSLRIRFDQQFFEDVRLSGQRVEGTGGTSASVSFGASVIASRRMLLDLGLSVGLTENAPDLAVTLSAPLEVKR
ncbi:transporter [Qipengyuania sphaerica]|uniref:transporter n=1 Tax=Qipengyuania sphaerica TaxID=2867243 RepID=UPI001C86F5D2|nr:transporter [Qipengyuania sphaerica]MBX7539658.1 transporter [Qipengyuania sphaerica]